jgi:hypothetical protein
MKTVKTIIKLIKEDVVYAVTIAISIILLFVVVTCSWLGYEVKNQCDKAQKEYGSDCVQSLISLLEDENKDFRSRNDAIWALGQIGDVRASSILKNYYTGIIPPKEPLDQTISQYELKKAINLTSGGYNPVAWTWKSFVNIDKNTRRETVEETIVVSARSDSYYSLAQKIAQEEKLTLFEDFTDVLQFNPRYILLVASPDNLTAEKLAGIGYIFKDQNYYPALGIISGSTLESAENLWQRRGLAKAGKNYTAGDVDILQSIYEPTIFNLSDGENKKIALNKKSLIEALKDADYFYWTRHTGPKDWTWNEDNANWSENDQLLARDIPPLNSAVIYSLTCRSFRPWVKDSIALGFIDKGAAAYLGFVNTPHTAAFIKHSSYLPGLTSWNEFPLGIIAQIHNRVATDTIFRSPQLFMLGDPRIYLSKDKPYQITSDTIQENGKRIIEGGSDTKGILSVKIDNGADYDFLTIKGLTSISEYDTFYNSKLQSLNLGENKYILFLHEGGRFDIELSRQPPFGWGVTDALMDAFDFSWVALWLSTYADGNPHIYTISILLLVGILLFKLIKQKKSLKDYCEIFIVALTFTFAHLTYFLLRQDDYTVSANLVNYTPLQVTLGCLGIFSGVAGGLILMKDGKKRVVKFLGLLLTILRQFWMTGFYLVFITLLNIVTPITKNTEPWLLSYDTFWLSAIVLICEVPAILVIRYIISDKRHKT